MSAGAALEAAFGGGARPATGEAPGRVTLVGEHVDYVGGRILAMTVDRAVSVALRPSADARWRVVSDGRHAERESPEPRGDIADRVLAPAVVLGGMPPLEVAVTSTLPEAAGLSSSAAVACAAMVAMLRLTGRRLTAAEAVDVALRAERDVVGVPCGELDQRTIIESRAGSALLLDCSHHVTEPVPMDLGGAVLLVLPSGERHDVGAGEYGSRRAAAEAVLRQLGVASCQEIGERWREVDDGQRPVARHIATETARAEAAAAALRAGDLALLGRLMTESHASLRDDYRVSTPLLDRIADTAAATAGCLGARMVGAGFGGSAIALCAGAAAAERVLDAVAAATGVAGFGVHSVAGLVESAADVVVPAS